MYEHMCIYRWCAACSELCNVRVSVHCGVHAIARNVLKHVQVVREDVRSLAQPFVYRKMFVNMRCRIGRDEFRQRATDICQRVDHLDPF